MAVLMAERLVDEMDGQRVGMKAGLRVGKKAHLKVGQWV